MKGAELRDLRKKMGLTQKGLAKELHIGLSTLQTWESDIRPISHANQKLILEVFARSRADNYLTIREIETQPLTFNDLSELEIYIAKNWDELKSRPLIQKVITLECKEAFSEYMGTDQFKDIVENIIKLKINT